MTSLKELLSSQGERLRDEQAARDRAIEGWTASVEGLIERIEAWIRESDPRGLVKVDRDATRIPTLSGNTYVNAGLNIRLGARETWIRPVALEVLGPRWKPGEGKWAGWAVMTGDPHGYELYRFLYLDGRDEWFIRDTKDYQIRSLDQSSFDEAIVRLLG